MGHKCHMPTFFVEICTHDTMARRTMYIWFPYKTPNLSECQYNTPLPKVHK